MSEALSGLQRVRVVLVRPSHPGNIGSAARAMQTMGLGELHLVKPERFPDAEARALAANAGEVLDAARVHERLDAALAGTSVQFAFSARSRSLSHEPQDVRQAASAAIEAAGTGQVALVFGNETYGLSNEEVLQCNRLACIPTDPASSSLNLAAAVQVAVYELRMAALVRGGSQPLVGEAAASRDLASHEDMERLFVHLEQSIVASGFLQPDNPRRLMERIRRLFGRSSLDREEVNILRGMLTAWDTGPYTGRGKPAKGKP